MATAPRLRLGQLLVDAGLLTQPVLDEVLALQKGDARRLGVLLVERGLINETQLTQILSHQLAIPWVSLLHIEFSRQLLNLVPRELAERFCVVPIYVRKVRGQGDTLYLAMTDPTTDEGLKEVADHAGLPVRAMIAPPSDIQNAIRVYYQGLPPKPPAAPPNEPRSLAVAARRSDRPPRSRPPAALDEPLPPTSLRAPPPPLPERKPRFSEAPVIEATEATLSSLELEEDETHPIPPPKGAPAAEMVALTLLDGTKVSLPTRKSSRPPPGLGDGIRDDETGLTARDLVAALRAAAHGADASSVLGQNTRWESLFAALLSILLKKQLVADWEFVDELKKG